LVGTTVQWQNLRRFSSSNADSQVFVLVTILPIDRTMTDRDRQRQLPHGELTERIIGCFFDAFGELGHGFSEAVLRRAMAIVLRQAGLQVRQEASLEVVFRGHSIGTFRADLIVEELVLVEVKATATIEGYAQTQLLNYLKAAGGGVGLLLNFGHKPEFKRLVMGDPTTSRPRLKP
jgi:GxxExxY protein